MKNEIIVVAAQFLRFSYLEVVALNIAAQAFGQKNTIFAIWMALVFLNPLTSVVGGFYSIWHNVINAWQLKKQKESK